MWKEPDTERSLRCPHAAKGETVESPLTPTPCASDPGFCLSPFFLEDQTGFCVCVCYFFRQKRLCCLGRLSKSVPRFDGSDKESVRKMCSCHMVRCHQGALAYLLRSSSRQKTCTSFFLAHCCFLRRETATDLHFKR